MFDFHKNRKLYFDIQVWNTEKHVIPFIEKYIPLNKRTRVLEIGCGEGGVLKAFINAGCTGAGVELEEGRIQTGSAWLSREIADKKIVFLSNDIHEVDPHDKILGGQFDLIILKDVIEHIHDQPKLIHRLKLFLKPEGMIFLGFPPWQMPFGGHQQMCRNKLLSRLPYYHLLPAFAYRAILQRFNEPVTELMEIRQTRISIEKFERILKKQEYEVVSSVHFLINPIYEWKFRWKPRKQYSLLRALPYIRNYFTTSVYYLVRPANLPATQRFRVTHLKSNHSSFSSPFFQATYLSSTFCGS